MGSPQIIRPANGEAAPAQEPPHLVITYDPATRNFAHRITPGIPVNELLGMLQRLGFSLLVEDAQKQAMEQFRQQQKGVCMPDGSPAPQA